MQCRSPSSQELFYQALRHAFLFDVNHLECSIVAHSSHRFWAVNNTTARGFGMKQCENASCKQIRDSSISGTNMLFPLHMDFRSPWGTPSYVIH